MKKIVLFIILIVGTQTLQAQTWSEWFRQKKTQIKYLVQQIAALEVYGDYLKKGYTIAKDGLNVISDIKHGDFNLHNGYFTSLKQVNPAIGKYVKVAAIVSLQVEIVQQYQRYYKQVKQSGQFTPDEIIYIYTVFTQLLEQCTDNINELIALTTSGELSLKDDERLTRIDAIYTDMQDKQAFMQDFGSQVQLLGVQRIKEQTDIETSRALHGINNP